MSEKKEICMKNEEEFFRIIKRGKKRIQTSGDGPVSPAWCDQRLPAQSGRGLFQLLSGREDAPESPDQRDDPGSPSSRLFSL